MKPLPDIILEARIAIDISQRELAERVQCSQAAITRLENNKLRPSIAMLTKLNHALGGVEGIRLAIRTLEAQAAAERRLLGMVDTPGSLGQSGSGERG